MLTLEDPVYHVVAILRVMVPVFLKELQVVRTTLHEIVVVAQEHGTEMGHVQRKIHRTVKEKEQTVIELHRVQIILQEKDKRRPIHREAKQAERLHIVLRHPHPAQIVEEVQVVRKEVQAVPAVRKGRDNLYATFKSISINN